MFINKSDYPSSIHTEILDAITRSNDNIVTEQSNTATSEMSGYLSSRYDVEAIFSATGDNRHPVVLLFAKDIALYHMHQIWNPVNIPDIRVKRYDDAIKWLTAVQEGKINPPDLPLREDDSETNKQYIAYGSNPKRNNQY